MKAIIISLIYSLSAIAAGNASKWFSQKLIDGHTITPLENGIKLEEARSLLIERAQTSIYITTFSISTDAVGQRLLERLCQKAKEGVDVRIIYDHRNNKNWYNNAERLKDCGGYVIRYRPHSRLKALHEKLLIVDGKWVINGGSGYSRKYMLAAFESKESSYQQKHQLKFGWYDHDYLAEGPIACQMHKRFVNNFVNLVFNGSYYNPVRFLWGKQWGGQVPKVYGLGFFKSCQEHKAKSGHVRMMALHGAPMWDSKRPIIEAYLKAIELSIERKEKEIKLYAPYGVVGTKLVNALIRAQNSGIQVTIIGNSESSSDEQKLIDPLMVATYVSLLPLVRKGGKLFFWNQKATLHRKGGIFGNSLTYYGSDNLDNRGQEYQSESVIMTDDPLTIAQNHKEFQRDLKHSVPVSAQQMIRGINSKMWLYRWVGKNWHYLF